MNGNVSTLSAVGRIIECAGYQLDLDHRSLGGNATRALLWATSSTSMSVRGAADAFKYLFSFLFILLFFFSSRFFLLPALFSLKGRFDLYSKLIDLIRRLRLNISLMNCQAVIGQLVVACSQSSHFQERQLTLS